MRAEPVGARNQPGATVSNLLTLSIIGFALTIFSLSLAWGIVHNLREGRQFRQQLAERLSHLRLFRLMRMLGLDPHQYLHQEQIVDVERHMRACEACADTQSCEQALNEHNPDAVADYCANFEELQDLRKRTEKVDHESVV